MNKKILLVLVIAFFLLVCCSLVSAESDTLYSDMDRFNRVNNALLGGAWYPDITPWKIDNNQAETDSGGGSEFLLLTNSSTTYIRFNYTSSDTNDEFLISVSEEPSEQGIYLRFRYDKLNYYDTTWQDMAGGETADGNMYLIELKNINYGADTYDIWINGTEIQTGADFRFATSSFTNFTMIGSVASLTNIDDVGSGSVDQGFELPADTTPPEVNLTYPADNSQNDSLTINFYATAIEANTIDNCTLWHNETVWQLEAINTSITSGVQFKLVDTFAAYGDYLWNIECCDDSSNCGINATNRTLLLQAINPTVTLDHPGNDTHNDSLNINFKCSATSGTNELATMSLYGNFSGEWALNETQLINGTSDFSIFPRTLEEQTYLWGCLVVDDSAYSDWNDNNFTVTIDTTFPVLTIDTDLTSNQLMVFQPNNFTASINCSDTYLYSLEISIDDLLFFDVTNITGTEYGYNFSYNSSFEELSTGVHWIEINCSDSHTAKNILDWDYTKNPLDKSIKYKFDDGWIKIKPKNKGLFSSFDTRKLRDRYTFEFERDWLAKLIYGNDMEFEVSSSHPLTIIPRNDYKGWLVSDYLNKWIDFSTISKYEKITVERETAKKITVYIKNIKDDSVIFNSIGELNVVSESYSFYFVNETSQTGGEEQEETANSLFGLGFATNSSYISDITASLVYNGTTHNPTKTTYANSINFSSLVRVPLLEGNGFNNQSVSYYWNYTVEGQINNQSETNITNTEQNVHMIIVTNCSLENATSLNFTIYNASGVVINSSIAATFTIWNDTSVQTRNWTFDYGYVSNPRFCIAPHFTVLNAEYEIEYSNASYDTNRYIVYGATLNNLTQHIDLYIYSGGTEITITVVDQYDDGLSNMIVEAHEYDLTANDFILITMAETDLDGIVKVDLDIAKKHKFIVKDNGVNVYESPTMMLYQTSYTFRITEITEESLALILRNLERSITWNESTRNIILTWNDVGNLITKIYLEVYKTNVSNMTLLSRQTSTAESGTLTYNLVNESGTYIGNVYVDAVADGFKYFIDSITIDERVEYDLFGTESLIMSILFIGTITMIGITISAEVGMVLAAIGMVAFYILGFINVALSGIIALIIGFIVLIVKVQRK